MQTSVAVMVCQVHWLNTGVPFFVQNQENEVKENEKEEEHENEKKEKEKKIERDLEPELNKETENKDNWVQVADPKPVRWPDMIAGNPPPSSMDHPVGLDTPPCRRYRRCAKNLPTLPSPKEDIVLEFTTSLYPIQKEKETEKKITEEAANKVGTFELLVSIQIHLLHQIKS